MIEGKPFEMDAKDARNKKVKMYLWVVFCGPPESGPKHKKRRITKASEVDVLCDDAARHASVLHALSGKCNAAAHVVDAQ